MKALLTTLFQESSIMYFEKLKYVSQLLSVISTTRKGTRSVLAKLCTVILIYAETCVIRFIFWLSVRQEISKIFSLKEIIFRQWPNSS